MAVAYLADPFFSCEVYDELIDLLESGVYAGFLLDDQVIPDKQYNWMFFGQLSVLRRF